MNLESIKNGNIRPYLETDRDWILALAEKYSEVEAIKKLLATDNYVLLVAPPLAAMAQFFDGHGCCLAGLCGPDGMRDMIRLSRLFVKAARIAKTELHGHWKVGSWQGKLAEQFGFDPMTDDFYSLIPMEKGN